MKLIPGLVFCCTMAAQSPDFGLQLGHGQIKPAALDLSSSSGALSVEPSTQRGFTLRGTAAWDLAPSWALEASLGWRFRSRGGLDYRSSSAGPGRLDVNQVLEDQMILGGVASRGFPFKTGLLSLGAGMDLRTERLSAETAAGSSSASLARIWGRAVARLAWSGTWRPYVALEFSVPLSRPSTSAAGYLEDLDRLGTSSNPSTGTVAKAHAPSSEILMAIGLRFPR
jgi:hypothetical protein